MVREVSREARVRGECVCGRNTRKGGALTRLHCALEHNPELLRELNLMRDGFFAYVGVD